MPRKRFWKIYQNKKIKLYFSIGISTFTEYTYYIHKFLCSCFLMIVCYLVKMKAVKTVCYIGKRQHTAWYSFKHILTLHLKLRRLSHFLYVCICANLSWPKKTWTKNPYKTVPISSFLLAHLDTKTLYNPSINHIDHVNN